MPYSMTRLAVSIGVFTLCFNLLLGEQSPEVNKDEKEEAAIALKEILVTVKPIQEELLIQRLGEKISVITDKQPLQMFSIRPRGLLNIGARE